MFVIRLSCYGDDYPVPEEDISFDVRVDVDQRLVCLSVFLSVCVCVCVAHFSVIGGAELFCLSVHLSIRVCMSVCGIDS